MPVLILAHYTYSFDPHPPKRDAALAAQKLLEVSVAAAAAAVAAANAAAAEAAADSTLSTSSSSSSSFFPSASYSTSSSSFYANEDVEYVDDKHPSPSSRAGFNDSNPAPAFSSLQAGPELGSSSNFFLRMISKKRGIREIEGSGSGSNPTVTVLPTPTPSSPSSHHNPSSSSAPLESFTSLTTIEEKTGI